MEGKINNLRERSLLSPPPPQPVTQPETNAGIAYNRVSGWVGAGQVFINPDHFSLSGPLRELSPELVRFSRGEPGLKARSLSLPQTGRDGVRFPGCSQRRGIQPAGVGCCGFWWLRNKKKRFEN